MAIVMAYIVMAYIAMAPQMVEAIRVGDTVVLEYTHLATWVPSY